MFFKQWLHSSIVRFALIAVVLCSIALLGARSTEVAQAAPQASTSHAVNKPTANRVRHYCHVVEVGEGLPYDGHNNVVIGCDIADGSIGGFAVSTVDAKRAARVLGIALTAKVTGQSIYVDYDPNDTNTPCDPANCRGIIFVGLREP